MASPSSPTLPTLFFFLFFFFLCARSERDSRLIRLPSDSGNSNPDALCPAGSDPPSCPINCFRTDPVCGVDGVTYWCGCADALCSGTRVAKLGYCEVGDTGNLSVSGQALLLVHIVWLIIIGFAVLFGFF